MVIQIIPREETSEETHISILTFSPTNFHMIFALIIIFTTDCFGKTQQIVLVAIFFPEWRGFLQLYLYAFPNQKEN